MEGLPGLNFDRIFWAGSEEAAAREFARQIAFLSDDEFRQLKHRLFAAGVYCLFPVGDRKLIESREFLEKLANLIQDQADEREV